ncbi:hypothetical protein K2173_013691 [Erythroxylum novogranatense]|uniref:Uncharacterized protein n=1 Tax=Erythroxylum novogranatense TaxID=1862640 RepID=A0AAV8SAL4_9ROSI|nr:hypothetical protein K2173_013691 [Erythroxylum novogranatense]
MGCFFACFGSAKDRRRRKRRLKVQNRDQIKSGEVTVESAVPLVDGQFDKSISPASEVRDKPDDQLTSSPPRKVTFDPNVKAYDHVSQESTEFPPDKGDGGNIFGKDDTSVKTSKSWSSSSEDSSITSLGSHPPNHRYQNLRDSDDELDYEQSDIDDDEDSDGNGGLDYDDICENDAIMDSSQQMPKHKVLTEEIDGSAAISGLPRREVKFSQNVRDRSAYVDSVLNPVENLSQWKAVKAKGRVALRPQKENLRSDQEPLVSFGLEPGFRELSFSFKSKSHQSKMSNQEIAVDASLSNWLSSSEHTPTNEPSATGLDTTTPEKSMLPGSNSPKTFEDRPILGALTMEELKQFSASSSPRKSPSRNPDDMPIIGTVGTYWNGSISAKDSGSSSSYKGIPNTTSKYREDKKVNWHSTPFETRLEKALNADAAKVYSYHASNVC